ncbi:MAG: class I SAM-dependent methyltransferase, partial [Lachnospiraceae bacterium]|nr:class I SAM-dependent methyltransferase [Lachnospiraceae bacterium]
MYEDFALVYDELMDDVPYEKWLDMLYDEILKHGVSRPGERTDDPLMSEKNLVLDLACGTGTLTELMYK